MTIIHTAEFDRASKRLFSAAEIDALETWLDAHPDDGDVIPGSGGCRKLRWAAKGKGKRGGARVIYFWRDAAGEIWLLDTYAKSSKSDLTQTEIRALKTKAKALK